MVYFRGRARGVAVTWPRLAGVGLIQSLRPPEVLRNNSEPSTTGLGSRVGSVLPSNALVDELTHYSEWSVTRSEYPLAPGIVKLHTGIGQNAPWYRVSRYRFPFVTTASTRSIASRCLRLGPSKMFHAVNTITLS